MLPVLGTLRGKNAKVLLTPTVGSKIKIKIKHMKAKKRNFRID